MQIKRSPWWLPLGWRCSIGTIASSVSSERTFFRDSSLLYLIINIFLISASIGIRSRWELRVALHRSDGFLLSLSRFRSLTVILFCWLLTWPFDVDVRFSCVVNSLNKLSSTAKKVIFHWARSVVYGLFWGFKLLRVSQRRKSDFSLFVISEEDLIVEADMLINSSREQQWHKPPWLSAARRHIIIVSRDSPNPIDL